MQAQRAIVTLAGPPQLTSTEQWAQIWTGFSTQFPLRNLHWKPATRTSIRTIQSLDANVVSFQSFKEEGASQIPSSLLERPMLNVYTVVCEVSRYFHPLPFIDAQKSLRTMMHIRPLSRSKSRIGITRCLPASVNNGSSF